MEKIYIKTEYIKLQQALKMSNTVGQGSDAKHIIQEGYVLVNGEICTMRGKKVRDGDVIKVMGKILGNGKDKEFMISAYDN